jgi:hypothetical protein
MINTNLLEQYKQCIRKAHDFPHNSVGFLENYKAADLLEKRIKTEVVKVVYQSIEEQLDLLDQTIRQEKSLIKTDA